MIRAVVPWLADELGAALASVPGSPEREHVAALLRRATRIRLGADVARAAAQTVTGAPGSIEDNLDRVSLPDLRPLWIEAPHRERVDAFAAERETVKRGPGTVGALLAADPGEPSHVATFVAWRLDDGSVHHAYALLHWNLSTMAEAARTQDGRDGIQERLMGLASAAVPPGLAAEMEIWQGVSFDDPGTVDRAIRRTSRDVLGEHVFLLAVLLLLDSSAVELEPIAREPDAPPSWEARLLTKPGRWETFRRRSGFRRPLFSGPLSWSRP